MVSDVEQGTRHSYQCYDYQHIVPLLIRAVRPIRSLKAFGWSLPRIQPERLCARVIVESQSWWTMRSTQSYMKGLYCLDPQKGGSRAGLEEQSPWYF